MPLPKMPSKPAALLSQADYPKAEKGRTVRPAIALVSNTPIAKVKTELPSPPKPGERKARAEATGKSQTSKLADKRGITKLFVLDTNVLMHDPTSLFRFEEHD
ncbi:MAG: PhoH family protein, partial [Betaproteobacteria bacterium]